MEGGFFMSSSGVCLIPLTKVFRCRNVFGATSKGLYYYENETDEDVCLDYSNNYNREIRKKMRVCLSFRGFCHQRLCLCRLGFFVAWILTEEKAERDAGYEKMVPLAGKIRSGHTILPAILPAGSGTACRTMSEINR